MNVINKHWKRTIRMITRTTHTNPRNSLFKSKLTNNLQKTLSTKYLIHEIIHIFTCSMRIV